MPAILHRMNQIARRQKRHVGSCKDLHRTRRQKRLHLRDSHFHNSLQLFTTSVSLVAQAAVY